MRRNWQFCWLLASAFLSLGGNDGSIGAAGAAPPAGLVSWWPGEGNGNDIISGNDATPREAVTFAPGKVGEAFQLNGPNAYLTVPASPSLDVAANGALTMEAWLAPTNVRDFHLVAEWNDAHGHVGAQLWIGQYPGDNGVLFANLTDTAGTYHRLYSPQNTIKPNVFQHVAVTYDQTTGLGALYVNGAVVCQMQLGCFVPDTRYDLWIGHRPQDYTGSWTYGSFLSGLLDEFSLYNRALSAAEIRSIYAAGSDGKRLHHVPPVYARSQINPSAPPTHNAEINPPVTVSSPPVLQIFVSRDNVTLQWPLWASNYTLQSAVGWPQGALWRDVSSPVITSNSQNCVTFPRDAELNFFRLRLP